MYALIAWASVGLSIGVSASPYGLRMVRWATRTWLILFTALLLGSVLFAAACAELANSSFEPAYEYEEDYQIDRAFGAFLGALPAAAAALAVLARAALGYRRKLPRAGELWGVLAMGVVVWLFAGALSGFIAINVPA